MKKIQFSSFVWLDINPEIPADLDNLDSIINLKNSTEQILKSTIHLQRLEEYADYMAVILHYPLYDKNLRKNQAVEIDCILSKGYFVTSHSYDVHFINHLMSNIENNTSKFQSPVDLYIHLIEKMLSSCMTPLNRIAGKIDFIEEEIFKGNEKNMISEISIVKRDVLDFRKTIRLHKSVIDSSIKLLPQYFPENQAKSKNISDIISTNIHIWNITENLKEAIEAFDQTNQTLLSHKLNKNIKTLTTFSTTLAPSTLFIGLLGINARMDFLDNNIAFFIAAFIAFTISLVLYLYFRRQDVI